MRLVPIKKKGIFAGGDENQSALWVKLRDVRGFTQLFRFLDVIASQEMPYIQVTYLLTY